MFVSNRTPSGFVLLQLRILWFISKRFTMSKNDCFISIEVYLFMIMQISHNEWICLHGKRIANLISIIAWKISYLFNGNGNNGFAFLFRNFVVGFANHDSKSIIRLVRRMWFWGELKFQSKVKPWVNFNNSVILWDYTNHFSFFSLSHSLTLLISQSFFIYRNIEKKEICFHKQSRCHGKRPINIFRWLKWLFGEWSVFFLPFFSSIQLLFVFSAFFPLI